MATTFTNSKTYAGELARPYIAAAIKSGDTIANRYITVRENVKYREVLRKLDTAGLVQDATCDFTPNGPVQLTERILEPKDLMVNLQLCKKDFRADWEALNTGRGFINDVLPPEFAQFLLLHIAAKIGEAMEENIWSGGGFTSNGSTADLPASDADGSDTDSDVGNSVTDTFDSDHFTGICKILETASSYTQATSSGAAFATGNILTNLDIAVDNLSTALQGDNNVHIYMSPKTYHIYYRKLVSIGTHPGFNYAAPINEAYLGYPLAVCPGMPNDTLVIGRPDNLFFGTDLLSDHNQAQVIDMTPMDGSDNVRVAYRFTGGVQVGALEDVHMVTRNA